MIDWNEVIELAHQEVRKLAEEESATMGAWWLFDEDEEDEIN